MPYPQAIKELAYANDPECWISYSGAPRWRKRYMEGRRQASLGTAVHQMMESILSHKEHPMAKEPYYHSLIDIDALFGPLQMPTWTDITFIEEPRRYNPPPMKIAMMLHFATTIGPYVPEASRTSPAYTKFIKQLLREGMVERPSREEREDYPGWAYRATEKGKAYVEALRGVQQPVATTTWAVPQ